MRLIPKRRELLKEDKKSGNVLVIYSKRHYDPHRASKEGERHYSASNLARNIFMIAEEIAASRGGKAYYVDQSEPYQYFGKLDIVIGTASKSFLSYAQKHKEARTFLFLVNSHPLWRLKTLIKESLSLKKTFAFSEYMSPHLFPRLERAANEIILIGNEFVRTTFVEYGIKKERIHLINSGVNTEILVPKPELRPPDTFRVLYTASDLGIRKGLFRVLNVWDIIEKKGIDAELVIAGGALKFKRDVDDFVTKHARASYRGWIDSHTEEYRQLLQSSHCIINPSLEEGQVGCVLEAMSCGAVPVITRNCGVDISNAKEGYLIEYADETGMADRIQQLMENSESYNQMSQKTLTYISTHHTWDTFRKIMRGLLTSSEPQRANQNTKVPGI